MEKSTHLKTVICGVALVALASVRPALAQTNPCTGSGSGEGSEICARFDANHPTNKYDFGTHAIKITANFSQPYDLRVEFIHITITPPQLDGRLNPQLAPADCIPYDGATSNTNLGDCGYYHVLNPPTPGGDFTGDVTYTVLWDFPTLDQLHNVRLYRAPLDQDTVHDFCPDGVDCYQQDITEAVIADLNSNGDPGVRGKATGFSDFEAVDRPILAAARIWIGLKNSDDVGTRFDLKAVVSTSGGSSGSGALYGALGGSSGFNKATLRTIPLPASAFSPGDTISLELFVRNSCVGSSHNSGTARLWFNDAAADSRVDEPGLPTLYLVKPGTTLNLSPSAGVGPKKTIDVFVGARNPSCTGGYTTFGTWSYTVPF